MSELDEERMGEIADLLDRPSVATRESLAVHREHMGLLLAEVRRLTCELAEERERVERLRAAASRLLGSMEPYGTCDEEEAAIDALLPLLVEPFD